jgi:hypothetical protein
MMEGEQSHWVIALWRIRGFNFVFPKLHHHYTGGMRIL